MCVCVCVYIYNQHSGGLDTRPTSLRTWVLASTINYALYISSPSQMVNLKKISSPSQMIDLKNKVSLGAVRVLLYIFILYMLYHYL